MYHTRTHIYIYILYYIYLCNGLICFFKNIRHMTSHLWVDRADSPKAWPILSAGADFGVGALAECLCRIVFGHLLVYGNSCLVWKSCSTKQYWEVRCASFVVQSGLGSTLFKSCSTKQYWEVRCASFVVESGLGSTLFKSCSTKQYWEVRCASFVVESGLGSTLFKFL